MSLEIFTPAGRELVCAKMNSAFRAASHVMEEEEREPLPERTYSISGGGSAIAENGAAMTDEQALASFTDLLHLLGRPTVFG